MCCIEEQTFSHSERKRLITIAHASIAYGLSRGHPPQLEMDDVSERLKEPGASFVTLTRGNSLRGCVGSLFPRFALIEDVNCNAFAAAFKDPRFPPVTESELTQLSLSLSILSSPIEVYFTDERDLLAQLHPNVDGLVISSGHRQATFLPSVWETLPDPHEFLLHLRSKAGIGPGERIEHAERYTVEHIAD